MSDEMFVSPEERLSFLGDDLIRSIIKTGDTAKANRKAIFGQLPPKVFSNENHIIYKVFYKFKDKCIVPDEDFMRMFLLRNENTILEDSSYVDLNAYSDLDENPATAYTLAVLKHFVRLLQLDVQNEDEFNLTLEKYKLEYKNIALGEALSKSKLILYDGLTEGKKHYQGYEDSLAYVKKVTAEIDGIIDSKSGAGFIDSSSAGLVDEETAQPQKVGDFGNLTELNKYLGGIYTPNFYSVIAPTKGGKSKFTSRMIHNIVVENGNNVVVWAHEGGHEAWWAQLRAIHFDYLYNKDEPDVTKHQMGISQDVVLKKTYPTEAVKALEQASRVDLFTNDTYGNIHMIDRPFNVETFIDEIDTAVQLNNAKAILIDYLQLIGWTSKNISKPQAIGKAYQDLLAYAKKKNISVISPAQFTQDFMKELSKSKDVGNVEVRTGGGESSEIVRTPDVNIALYASAEDLINHTMKILSVPSRMSAPFPSFDIYCDLGVCQFVSLDLDS